jgi:hypothetical protein
MFKDYWPSGGAGKDETLARAGRHDKVFPSHRSYVYFEDRNNPLSPQTRQQITDLKRAQSIS